MSGPCDHGGIHMHLPDGDSVRDVVGLILATLRGDSEGRAAIRGNCNTESVDEFLEGMVAAMLIAAVRHGQDPDAPPGPLTERELQAAEAILITGIEGPDDNLSQWPG